MEPTRTQTSAALPDRIPALDAIRFACALSVVYWHVAHVAWPMAATTDTTSTLLRGVVRALCNGPAAVIVFFVISGFCIHYPFRNQRSVDAGAFLTRRFLRIGIPFAAALVLAKALHWRWMDLSWGSFGFLPASAAIRDTDPTVFWSLIAEIGYYALYPALFVLGRRHGWGRITLAAYVPALAVMSLAPSTGEMQGFGNALAPVVALPAWLWGCVMAERWDQWRSRSIAPAKLWLWRGAVVASATAILALRFHPPVALAITPMPWTLHPFAILVFFWLQREVASARTRPLPRILEWSGQWSYSLYLVHLGAFEAWLWVAQRFGGALPVVVQLPLQAALILSLCYAFHLGVERPSWQLARALGRRMLERRLPAARPVPGLATEAPDLRDAA